MSSRPSLDAKSKPSDVDLNILEAGLPEADKPVGRLQAFYRSTFFQMLVVGMLAFAGPAMSDAIAGLGGGGLATPYTANAASAASYAMMALFCFFGGPIVGRLGLKTTLLIGAATFPFDGSSLYVNSKYSIQWYLILGSALSGIGYGLWYVSEAGIILSYPEQNKRGRYLSLWIVSRNLGQLVGGAINLSTNVNSSTTGGIAASTYLIFVAIECLGFPAGFLFSAPDKVRRSDGSKINVAPPRTLREEMKLFWKAAATKRTLLLAIYFFYSFFYISVYGTYLSLYFSLRARALSSLISPAFCIIGCFTLGWVLDHPKLSQPQRAKLGFAIIVLSALGTYIYTFVVQAGFNKEDPGFLDLTDNGWARAFMPYFLIQTFGPMGQNYMYWLLSSFATDVQSNARNGGVFRSIEAIGQAVSFGINASGHDGFVGFGINFGLLIACIIPTWLVVRTVPEASPMEEEERAQVEMQEAVVGGQKD